MLYPVAIETDENGSNFGVVVPDVPGCFSAGDSFEGALANAKEALESHFEIMAESGQLPPKASSVNQHFTSPDFAGWLWALVDVDIEPYLGKSSKINVTLPDLLAKQIDTFVQTHSSYKNRSHFLQLAAIELMQSHTR